MWEQPKESKPECVKTCGKHTEKEVVYIDYYVMAKINHLMKKYPDLEWLGYLIGKDNVVEDMYLPEQKVTAAAVTDIKGNPEIEIIGVVHSHHKLGLQSFSGTDHEYINGNHALSILVWHGGINGQKRVTLPCGANMIVPIEIQYFHPELNSEEWEKEADDNISEKKYTYSPVPGYGGGYLGTHCEETRQVGNGKFYEPTAAEKKTERNERELSSFGRNATANSSWEDYLDQLVYDNAVAFEKCAEDDYELDQDEVEEHFKRIEERSCGLVPRTQPLTGKQYLDEGGNLKKVIVGPWEV